MDTGQWIEVAIIVLGLCLLGLCASADATLRTITRMRVRELIDHGLPKARALDSFVQHSSSHSATIILLQTIAFIGIAVAATLLAVQLAVNGALLWLGTIALVLLMTLVQLLPKMALSHDGEGAANVLADPLHTLTMLLSPVIVPLQRGLGAALGAVGRTGSRPPLGEDELRTLGLTGEEGILDEEEQDMIHGIMTMEDVVARELMTPRIDIIAVDAETTVGELADVIAEQGYSRVPVYRDSIDDILGVVYAKDLFSTLKSGQLQKLVTDLMRPAYFVPESKRADELLHEMQEHEIHMAIIVDEYGGTAGLVTIEDVLEEIVGEIRDEYDRGEEVKIEAIEEGQAAFDGTVTLDDVNETLGLTLNVEDVDTIGGLVYDRLGKMPSVGDEVTVDDAVIRVLETDGRRIRRVLVIVGGHHDEQEGGGPETAQNEA